jgi:prophage regulatory protein
MDMSDRYLRRSEVERSTGLSRSTIYRRINEGSFPAPYNLGGSCVRWREQA